MAKWTGGAPSRNEGCGTRLQLNQNRFAFSSHIGASPERRLYTAREDLSRHDFRGNLVPAQLSPSPKGGFCDVRAPDRDGGMRRHSHARAAAAATKPRTSELLARTRMVLRGVSRYRVLHQQQSELWPVWQLLQSHIGIVQRSILRMRGWLRVVHGKLRVVDQLYQ